MTRPTSLTSSHDTDVISQFKLLLSVRDTSGSNTSGSNTSGLNVLSFQEQVDYLKTTTTHEPILSGATKNWANLPTLQPALPATVQLSLTIVYIAIFGFIFILSYAQLWLIWYHRHKRLSHQTIFLFLCLVWSGLRTSLFSFYFNNCDTANALPSALFWLLYCFPVCLQFSMLCLLLNFFAQVSTFLWNITFNK